MKIIKDRNKEEYENLRDKEKKREVINDKEKEICKMLYDNLDKLTEQENDRVHKIKEQTIIYFSLHRKYSCSDLGSARKNWRRLTIIKSDWSNRSFMFKIKIFPKLLKSWLTNITVMVERSW